MGIRINKQQVRQWTWLVVGTLLPFLLIFALPLIGLGEGATLTLAKLALFGFHVVVMVRHGGGRPDGTAPQAETDSSQSPEVPVHYVSLLRCGFALGTGAFLGYLGCVAVMLVLPRDLAARFFNNLLHCVDLEPIIDWQTPLSDMFLGLISVFILGWLFAAVVAGFYNLAGRVQPRG